MKVKMKQVKEKEFINSKLLMPWMITVAVISLAYLIEVIKGERSMGYYLILLVLGWIPIVIAFLVYKRDKTTDYLKHFVTYGYSALYIFVLLTGDTVLTFVYIFPILSALIVTNDYKLFRVYAIINIAVNVLVAVWSIIITGNTSADNIADREIEVFATILVLGFAYSACKNSRLLNDLKMQEIEEKENKQTALLTSIDVETNGMSQSAKVMHSNSSEMSEKFSLIGVSMSEIAKGTTETAETIQNQLEDTTNIQSIIEDTKKITDNVLYEVEVAKEQANIGVDNSKKLGLSAEEASQVTKDVKEKADQLNVNIQEANKIVSMINEITEQTTLLSFNASIEAARAGDSGRGFSVVAGEIKKLAEETKSATKNIVEILKYLDEDSSKVFNSVTRVIEVSDKQGELIAETEKNFRTIQDSVLSVADKTKAQASMIDSINNSTRDMFDSIESLSAFSEELMANTESTNEQLEESINIGIELEKNISSLVNEIGKLRETLN